MKTSEFFGKKKKKSKKTTDKIFNNLWLLCPPQEVGYDCSKNTHTSTIAFQSSKS